MKDKKKQDELQQEDKKQKKKGGKGRKILFRCIALLVALVLLAAGVHIAFLFHNKSVMKEMTEGEQGAKEIEQYFAELEEEYEEVTYDRQKGVVFVNNEVILMTAYGVERSAVESILEEHDGTIVDAMEDIGFYKAKFDDEYTLKKLEKLIDRLAEYEEIEQAYVNPVLDIGGDDGEPEEDKAEKTKDASGVPEKEPVYPKDPWKKDAWDVKVPEGANWGMEAIRAPQAWGYLEELNSVGIGLIDGMVNTDHEDLSATCYLSLTNIEDNTSATVEVTPKSLTPSDHGSHVAGIMAAKWNEEGVSGVLGDKAELFYSAAYNIKDDSVVSEYYDAYNYVKAIKVLVDAGVQSINISQNTCRLIGFAASHGNKNAINHLRTQAELAGDMLNRMVEKIEMEHGKDFVICVAAGNSNNIRYYKDDSATYGYKETADFVWEVGNAEKGGSQAKYNNFLNLIEEEAVKNRVIVVGSVGIDTKKSNKDETRYRYSAFSNIGERVDIVAPGEDIYSCYVKDYDYMSGTSMATPFVTAVSGMVFAANPELSGPEVKRIVCASTYGKYYYEDGNSGLLDASMAVKYALETVDASVGRVLKQSGNDGLDLCFLVDTTGSMGDDIDNTKENMESILASLAEKGIEYRISIVDYRDFADRTGDSADYPAKVQLPFSNDKEAITTAIQGLTLGYGGDSDETVYSGFAAALGLDWRPSAKKAIIVLGDAAPLDPEPNTGYTYDSVVAALYDAKIGVDTEQSDDRVLGDAAESLMSVYTIGTEASGDAIRVFESISEATGGAYTDVADATEVSGAIVDSIEMIEIVEPINVALNFGNGYAYDTVEIYKDGEFQYEVVLDEKGSFKLEDMEEDRYEWKIPTLAASGQFKVKENTKKVSPEIEQPWYGFALKLWQKNRVELIVGCLGAVVVLIAALTVMSKVKKAKRKHAPEESVKEEKPKEEKPKKEKAPKKEKKLKKEKAPVTGTETKEPVSEKTAEEPEKERGITFCLHCGTMNDTGAKFCGGCGAKIE